jgi:hypothetical protein
MGILVLVVAASSRHDICGWKAVATRNFCLLLFNLSINVAKESLAFIETTMNCFGHRNSAAVAICRACGRGACANCARETEHSVACSEICESRVRLMDQIVNNNVRVMKVANSQNWMHGMYGLFAGCIFLAMSGFAYLSGQMMMVFMLAGIGLPLALLGLTRLFQNYPVVRQEESGKR